MMWTREGEDKLIKRCLSAAASDSLPLSANEADVFRTVAQLVTTNYPDVAAALSHSSETYFATHLEEHRRTFPDVVKAGLVSDLSRLRNLLEHQLKGVRTW
jgi:hypothetical protein